MRSGIAFWASALEVRDVGAAFETIWKTHKQVAVHDLKSLVKAAAVDPREVVDDTMIAAHLLNPSRAYSRLGDAVEEHLGIALGDDAASWADAVWRLSEKLRHVAGFTAPKPNSFPRAATILP